VPSDGVRTFDQLPEPIRPMDAATGENLTQLDRALVSAGRQTLPTPAAALMNAPKPLGHWTRPGANV
jgi:hypothetical protein